MKKVAIVLVRFKCNGEVEPILSIHNLDIEWYRNKYGSLRQGLEQIYSKCPNISIINYYIIDSVRINYDF